MADLDAFVAKMGTYEDDIFSDPVALELDVELEETEDEYRDRLTGILQNSSSGDDLFENCVSNLPNSAQSYGLTLTMNRAIKFLVTNLKLPAEATVGWKRLSVALKNSMKEAFQNFPKGSREWNVLITILLKVEKPKKTSVKRNSSSLPTSETVLPAPSTREIDGSLLRVESIVEQSAVITQGKSTVPRRTGNLSAQSVTIKTSDNPPSEATESNRLVDRIALLACALVDPLLLDMWTDIAAPIPACERPAGKFMAVGSIFSFTV